jgi:toxin-antitoxin system PIN domain toxin
MLLVDSNLLLYAYVQTSPFHEAARSWLDARMNGEIRIGLPWISLLAFLRLSTNRHINPGGPPLNIAVAQVDRWLSSRRVWTPQPGEAHHRTLSRLLTSPSISSKDLSDAHLAALAIDHGLILCSSNVGFARFPGLRWENPLAT